MTPESDRGKTWASAALVTALAGLLYFFTAARDIVTGDTPELITVAATLGVAHPPGYPLFTLLGHLFSLLPIGPIPFRVNLLSVTCDALAVGVVFLIAFRLSKSRPASAVAALALAVNPIFWTWALAGEVFALNNLLAATMIYLLVRWHEQPERKGFLIAASFTMGLGLTNHQTMVLLAPAFAFVLWERRAVWHWRLIDICALAFGVGLLPYAYIPWAAAHHPFMNWGDVSSLRELLDLIARRSYGSAKLVSTVGYSGGSALDRILHLFVSLGGLMGLLALLGVVWAWRSERWYFWFTLLAFGFVGPFFAALTNLNLATAPAGLFVLQRFFVLPQVVIAPLAALGVVAATQFITSKAPSMKISPVSLVAGAATIVMLITVFTNYRAVDQSQNHVARHLGEDVLTSVQPGAILLARGDSVVLPLAYLLAAERARPDVTFVFLPLLPADWYLRELRQRHPDLKLPFDHYDPQTSNLKMLLDANAGRPIALAGAVPDNDHSLDEGYRFRQRGLISVIEPKDQKDLTLLEAAKDNEEQIGRFTFPVRERIKANTFEKEFLTLYAISVAHLGRIYERMGRKVEALSCYRRAHALDPELPNLREALARVGP